MAKAYWITCYRAISDPAKLLPTQSSRVRPSRRAEGAF